jgi:hypothetical protein
VLGIIDCSEEFSLEPCKGCDTASEVNIHCTNACALQTQIALHVFAYRYHVRSAELSHALVEAWAHLDLLLASQEQELSCVSNSLNKYQQHLMPMFVEMLVICLARKRGFAPCASLSSFTNKRCPTQSLRTQWKRKSVGFVYSPG